MLPSSISRCLFNAPPGGSLGWCQRQGVACTLVAPQCVCVAVQLCVWQCRHREEASPDQDHDGVLHERREAEQLSREGGGLPEPPEGGEQQPCDQDGVFFKKTPRNQYTRARSKQPWNDATRELRVFSQDWIV